MTSNSRKLCDLEDVRACSDANYCTRFFCGRCGACINKEAEWADVMVFDSKPLRVSLCSTCNKEIRKFLKEASMHKGELR